MKTKYIVSSLAFLCLTSSCSQMNMNSLTSLPQNPVGSIYNKNAGLGGVDIAKAASAAKDLGGAVMMTDEEIKSAALGFAKHSDKTNRIAPDSNPYAIRLKKLTDKHRNEDGLNLNFKVYLTKNINAFAMADGTVRVLSGIMDLMNDDELLAIIGHEIGHVKLGHSAGRVKLASVTSGLRKGVGSTSGLAGALANEGLVGGMVEKVINSQFSQSQETDSDEYGVNFLRKHGYNLDGAISAFNKLAELDKGSNKSFVDGILSSHPASKDRAEHLAELIGEDSKVKIATNLEDKKDVPVKNEETKEVNKSSENETTASNENEDSHAKTAKHDVKIEGSSSKSEASEDMASNEVSSEDASSGWYLQVAALKNYNSADLVKRRLRELGYDVSEQIAQMGSTELHRILVGPYAEKSSAMSNKKKLISEAELEDTPIIRYVE